jgi:hypothetical protein
MFQCGKPAHGMAIADGRRTLQDQLISRAPQRAGRRSMASRFFGRKRSTATPLRWISLMQNAGILPKARTFSRAMT